MMNNKSATFYGNLAIINLVCCAHPCFISMSHLLYYYELSQKGDPVPWVRSTHVLVRNHYQGLNLARQKSWKLGVFGFKLEGSHSPFY